MLRLTFLLCLLATIPLHSQWYAADTGDVIDILPSIKKPFYFQPYSVGTHLMDRIDVLSGSGGNLHIHTAIKPYYNRTYSAGMAAMYGRSRQDQFNDRVAQSAFFFGVRGNKPLLRHFYTHPNYLYSHAEERFGVAINPLFHLEAGSEAGVDEFKYVNTRGAEMIGYLGDKVTFFSRITENQANFPEYVMADRNGNRGILRGESITKGFKDNGIDFLDARGYISADIMPELNVQFGQDRNFIGNGFRSLILSDQSEDYLFLKLNTRVWRIHYMNLFAEMVDSRNRVGETRFRRKYLAAHYISADITKNLNVGLFETVVHGGTDTTDARLEWYYLNPIIFYRAVEYGIGSPHNVLIGLNWRYNFLKHASFYGQFVIDEWKFYDLVRGTGWWGNKYAFQAGLKYYDAFGVSNLDLQLEYNSVRPYMYTHFNVSSNYSHYRQPLAHPLGANFTEWVGRLRWQPMDRLFIDAIVTMVAQGVDSTGTNWGNNILLDYSTREREFGNVIGQGVSRELGLLRLNTSWMLRPNMWLEAYFLYRRQVDAVVGLSPDITRYAGVSFRMNFEGRRFYF